MIQHDEKWNYGKNLFKTQMSQEINKCPRCHSETTLRLDLCLACCSVSEKLSRPSFRHVSWWGNLWMSDGCLVGWWADAADALAMPYMQLQLCHEITESLRLSALRTRQTVFFFACWRMILKSFILQFFLKPVCQSVWWQQLRAFNTPCSCQGEWPCRLRRSAWRWKRFWLLDKGFCVYSGQWTVFFSELFQSWVMLKSECLVWGMSHARTWHEGRGICQVTSPQRIPTICRNGSISRLCDRYSLIHINTTREATIELICIYGIDFTWSWVLTTLCLYNLWKI